MKKAISPVIATLLLILIAVAAAVLVYVWVTGYASSMTKAGAPELQEQIKVEAVSYDPDTDTLTVYIRNIGDTKVTISAIYVINATTNEVVKAVTGDDIDNSLKDLDPGEVGSQTIDKLVLEPGVTHIVKAVTKNGIEAAMSFSYSE